MSIPFVYIVKSVLISGLLYLYYHIALKDKKFHSYNRFFLIGTTVVSLVFPLFNFTWYKVEGPKINSVTNLLLVLNQPPRQLLSAPISASLVLSGFVILISLILFALFLSKICWIYKLKRKYKNTRMQGFTFIETPVKQAPFSFLSNLFWRAGAPLNSDTGEKIFSHELIHIKQKHSYDKIFTQVTVCLFWMNPFYWIIQNELTLVHEYIADSGCIAEGDTKSFAIMLLQSHNNGGYLDPSHAFFHSSIKRRLIMITTSKHAAYSYARRSWLYR